MAEKRRVIEPVFGELKDRQRQLERWLTDLETDDSKNNIADRLKDLTHNVAVIHERKAVLQESLTTLNRFKDRNCEKSETELVPSSPDAGLDVLIADLRVRRDQLTASLDQLETSGEEKLHRTRRGALQGEGRDRATVCAAGRRLQRPECNPSRLRRTQGTPGASGSARWRRWKRILTARA